MQLKVKVATNLTAEFTRLRTIGIYATLQTLPSGFRVTLSSGVRTCWGDGDTAERATSNAIADWNRQHGKHLQVV